MTRDQRWFDRKNIQIWAFFLSIIFLLYYYLFLYDSLFFSRNSFVEFYFSIDLFDSYSLRSTNNRSNRVQFVLIQQSVSSNRLNTGESKYIKNVFIA